MQQSIRHVSHPIHAKLTLPGEKGITFRALMMAALADGVSEISNLAINEDTKTLINALHQLGIVSQLDEQSCSCIIAGGNGKFPKKQATLWCGDNLALARFLITACSTSAGVYYFDGSPILRKRSLIRLVDILKRQGVQLIPSDGSSLPFTLVGADSLAGGEIIFDGPHATPLISALAIIAPYARSPLTLTMMNYSNSQPLEITCEMMAEFGVLVHRIHQNQLMAPVPQRYQSKDYAIEPDCALATYFFAAAAATGGDITIQPINRANIKQTDIQFLTVLENMGCYIHENRTGLTVTGAKTLEGIEVSMPTFADSFLALAALAPFANSPTRILHLYRDLKPKERERMLLIHGALLKMGIQAEHGDNWLKIFPGTPRGGLVGVHHDYRIGLACSIIGLRTPGIIIEDAEKVTAAYPNFFALWEHLAEKSHLKA